MKRNKDPPAAIEAYQKRADEMTEAREKKTPPEARLRQHDNCLQALEWEKGEIENSLKITTETLKYWENQADDLKKSLLETQNKFIEAEKSKSDFMLAGGKQIEKKPKSKITDFFNDEAKMLLTQVSHDGSAEANAAAEGFEAWNKYVQKKTAHLVSVEGDDSDEDEL